MGQTTHSGQNFDSNRKVLSLLSSVASLKRISSISDFIHIFSWFNKCIQLEVRADNPRDKILMSTETSCHFSHLLQVSKKSLWSLILYIFFSWFHTCIQPEGRGWQPLGDEMLMSTGTSCHFGHLLQVSKKSLWSLILYNFFSWFYTCIKPQGSGRQLQRDKIFMSTEMSCHFIHLLQVLKKCLWSLILYNFLHDLIHVYNPGAGTESPQGTKFLCQQEGLITLPICCKFQRNLFEVWFYTFFFHDLIHVYSPWAGAYSPPGDKVLMSTETSCHFGHLLPVSNHRQQ